MIGDNCRCATNKTQPAKTVLTPLDFFSKSEYITYLSIILNFCLFSPMLVVLLTLNHLIAFSQ